MDIEKPMARYKEDILKSKSIKNPYSWVFRVSFPLILLLAS